MRTYLLQRASFKNREFKKGVDSILRFDYMGSSEFEWGALPSSLDAIRKFISEYTYMDVPIRGKIITVFCQNDKKPLIKKWLEDLADGKFHTKEYTDFDNYINDSKNFPSRTDFWWDIENNIMFWRKNNEFEISFKTVILGEKAERL